jgi:hypothetical protein
MMFKAYQYITNNDKVFVELKNVNVKEIQTNLNKTIT